MSGNRNVANYCDFGSNRTSNVRVNQGPGGNSSLSLAWDAPSKPVATYSGNRGGGGSGGMDYGQKESNPYSNYSQPNNYSHSNNLPPTGYPYTYEKHNDTSSYQPIGGNRQQYGQESPSKNQYDSGYKNRNAYEANTYGQKSYQDSYDKFQEQQQQRQQPSFAKKSEMAQNGRSTLQLGSDYNYQGNNYSRNNDQWNAGQNVQRSNDYSNMNNNQGSYSNQYGNAGGYSNRQGGGNPIGNNNNNSRGSNQYPGDNLPRQPNNLHDVKFGYRVNQPPGGRSNITFG